MFGKLKGIVDSIYKDHLIIDVGGVGYIVFCSNKTMGKIPNIGKLTCLLIDTQVREDGIYLYGFLSEEEKFWFKELITVKGVGSRVALAILSILEPKSLSVSILAKDKTAFKQVSGVGPKLAERIILELKGKIGSSDISIINEVNLPTAGGDGNLLADAVSALVNLGYNRSDAYNIATRLLEDDSSIEVGELIRHSLKELAK